jgi:DNA-binding response OmpR family regulator
LVASALALAGFEVVAANDGYSALRLAVGERFDALLTDLRMPGLSGDAVARRVRRVHPELPVLLMTACHASDVSEQSWTAVIRKPFAIDALVAALDRATRTPDRP